MRRFTGPSFAWIEWEMHSIVRWIKKKRLIFMPLDKSNGLVGVEFYE